MKKILIAIVILIVLVVFVGMPFMKAQTKKHSPEKTTTYTKGGLDLSVTYSSPSKKGRVIFGELVPFDAVWRTGANEPTTFTTKTDILIVDKKMSAGTYSIWTIPNKKQWKVIFNEEVPDWGVTMTSGGSETTRDPEADFVQVEIPVRQEMKSVENFSITFNETNQLYLNLIWDTTKIEIPISPISE